VLATAAALDLIERLRGLHGPLMFHQSGGCCDGSQPMCFTLGEFKTGASDWEMWTTALSIWEPTSLNTGNTLN